MENSTYYTVLCSVVAQERRAIRNPGGPKRQEMWFLAGVDKDTKVPFEMTLVTPTNFEDVPIATNPSSGAMVVFRDGNSAADDLRGLGKDDSLTVTMLVDDETGRILEFNIRRGEDC